MWKFLALIAVLDTSPLAAGPSGAITVIDGDTIDVGGQRVRLYGIDAPEIGQPCTYGAQIIDCGTWLAGQVADRFAGAQAQCTARDVDRYGRIVATCDVAGHDMGAVIVGAGWALAYRRYSDRYDLDEKAAAVAGRGLWAAQLASPESYRAAASPAAPNPDCLIKGNISASGQIYHRPGNRDYTRTRIDQSRGERWFCTEAEALAAGWRPARN